MTTISKLQFSHFVQIFVAATEKHSYAHTQRYKHRHTYTNTYTHTHTHKHTHIHTHTQTHTHTHTHIFVFRAAHCRLVCTRWIWSNSESTPRIFDNFWAVSAIISVLYFRIISLLYQRSRKKMNCLLYSLFIRFTQRRRVQVDFHYVCVCVCVCVCLWSGVS